MIWNKLRIQYKPILGLLEEFFFHLTGSLDFNFKYTIFLKQYDCYNVAQYLASIIQSKLFCRGLTPQGRMEAESWTLITYLKKPNSIVQSEYFSRALTFSGRLKGESWFILTYLKKPYSMVQCSCFPHPNPLWWNLNFASLHRKTQLNGSMWVAFSCPNTSRRCENWK